VLATWGLAHHIYFDRSGVPDLEPFIRFELSTIGKVYDARGTVLVELAREYRQVVSYEEVLRHAILAAEDKNFFGPLRRGIPGAATGALHLPMTPSTRRRD
jgi:membrane carboxypeptidase/penicillin-binding protein